MKKIPAKNIVIVLVICLLCGCVEQLKELNSALENTRNTLVSSGKSNLPVRSNTSVRSSEPVGSNMPEMSEDQLREMHEHLSTKLNDKALLKAREEATPNIEKILPIFACYPSWDVHRYLAAYSASDKHEYSGLMFWMKYHPKSQCLSVTRVDNWTRTAKNAVSFRAIFVSDASAESKSVNYEMIRDTDGTWLLR